LQNLQPGRAIAQALSEWPLTAEDWAQSLASPCGVCGLSLSYCHSSSVSSSYFHLQPTIHTTSNLQHNCIMHLTEVIASSYRIPSYLCFRVYLSVRKTINRKYKATQASSTYSVSCHHLEHMTSLNNKAVLNLCFSTNMISMIE
jgi:hypothetical protein